MNIVLHILRILSVFFIFVLLGTNIGLAQARQKLVVVELFTSQGCNLCPPADDLLAEFGAQEHILTLGYSVDYWNYLGWKDTLARPGCVARQRKYNKTLGKSGVYTPQMVIQGTHDVIGSRRDLVQDMVTRVRLEAENLLQKSPEITFHRSGDMIDLWVSASKSDVTATVWIIGYDYEKTVTIKSGELGGQVRKYHNVVQMIRRVGIWTGQEVTLALSKADLDGGQSDAYALLLQTGGTGPIIAAAKLAN